MYSGISFNHSTWGAIVSQGPFHLKEPTKCKSSVGGCCFKQQQKEKGWGTINGTGALMAVVSGDPDYNAIEHQALNCMPQETLTTHKLIRGAHLGCKVKN